MAEEFALLAYGDDGSPVLDGSRLNHGLVESRTAALCALVAATGLDRKIFTDLDRKQTQARLKEIGAGAWAAASVKKTIEEIETAVTVTLITAVS